MAGECLPPHMPEAFPEQIVRLRRASTMDHAQTDRRTLGPLQTDKYRYRIFIYEIGRKAYTSRAPVLSLRLGSRIVPGTPSSLERKLAASDRSFKVPTDEFSRINDFGLRSQIQWHTQVVCPCFPVLLANQIRPVRQAQ